MNICQSGAAIREGEFHRPLVDDIEAAPLLDSMHALMRDKVYNSRAVLTVEVAGFEVIGGLLEILTDALVMRPNAAKAMKVRGLIPAYLTPDCRPHPSVYDNLLSVTEFVASMTDSYAIDLYRTLTGIQLPNY